jgi:dipeptidyl aminopeptidase/acylaminoacyl peptidase
MAIGTLSEFAERSQGIFVRLGRATMLSSRPNSICMVEGRLTAEIRKNVRRHRISIQAAHLPNADISYPPCSKQSLGNVLLSVIAIIGLFGASVQLFSQSVAAPASMSATVKPAQFEDFFKFQKITTRPGFVTQDGKWIAYMVDRSAASSANTPPLKSIRTSGSYIPPFADDRADIWIRSVEGGWSRRITNGQSNGAGYWDPQWSPDGQRLAMLSTDGGELAYWVWTRSSSKLNKLMVPDIHAGTPFIVWVSNTQVLSTIGHLGTETQATPAGDSEATPALLPNRPQGPTASVLDTGVSECQPAVHLWKINVITREKQLVGRASGLSGNPVVSPDRRWVVMSMKVGCPTFQAEGPITRNDLIANSSPSKAIMFDLSSPGTEMLLKGLPRPESQFQQFSWAPDSSLLFVSKVLPSVTPLSICRVANGSCSTLRSIQREDPGTEFGSPVWFGDHDLLISTRPGGAASIGSWWRVDADGNTHPFFESVPGIPQSVVPLRDGSGFVGIDGASVWQFDADGNSTRNLTPTVSFPVTSIFTGPRERSVEETVVLIEATHVGREAFKLQLGSGDITALSTPTPETHLIDFDAATGLEVFGDGHGDSGGTQLWLRTPKSNGFQLIARVDTFIQTIAPFNTRLIEYQTVEGEDAFAAVLLPPHYQSGSRYPVIVSVYPDTQFKTQEQADEQFSIIKPVDQNNLQLFAAHGYVVLVPSMPGFATSMGFQSDEELQNYTKNPYMRLEDGVVPAIDKLVALGIADPDRIGLIGHSYGGFAAYGLVTQTNRFKAAVSMAGFCDLTSFYLSVNPWTRHVAPEALLDLFGMEFTERILRLGNPPWRDTARFTSNSPISYVDRVHTPVMIVQGDMDYVPIEQGEEFFRALQRQDKRVEFVRYWGEGHVIGSPANLHDLWIRIYEWFDQFLKPGEAVEER